MEIKKVICLIENFAPLELQESWDNCGFQVFFGAWDAPYKCYEYSQDIKKILLCVSVTQDVVNQAAAKNCDMIISHHPLFFVPFTFNKNIPIYSAHTNLDKADGGTTDTLIEVLGFNKAQKVGDFLRLISLEKEISLESFVNLIKAKLNIKNLRIVNNLNKQAIGKIAFCAGSGMDLLGEAQANKADVFVTGDVKYHNALESNVIIIDVGHFESELPILKTIRNILEPLNLEVVEADEKSPFINY